MKIHVPKRKRTKARVPSAGWKEATLDSIDLPQVRGESYCLHWSFRAKGRSWKMDQAVSDRDFKALLLDMGFGGQDVVINDIVGKRIDIYVTTFGNKTSAAITQVRAVADS